MVFTVTVTLVDVPTMGNVSLEHQFRFFNLINIILIQNLSSFVFG
jgi:hypothetical protein